MSKLILAFPSKGRIKEMAEKFIHECDLTIGVSGRNYSGSVREIPGLEILFRRPTEIPSLLLEGKIDCGNTGEDLLSEFLNDRTFSHISLPLGFGRASLVTAVPKSWSDVVNMRDLADVSLEIRYNHGRGLRVATGFPNLTRVFFNEHSINDFRIIESSGATEGMPMAGTADVIVDITSTGSTLDANDLKQIHGGTILDSQVCLFLTPSSSWDNEKCEILRKFLIRLETRQRTANLHQIRFNFPEEAKAAIVREFPKTKDRLTILNSSEEGFLAAEAICTKDRLHDLSETLANKGAAPITAVKIDYLLDNESTTFIKFMRLLGRTN